MERGSPPHKEANLDPKSAILPRPHPQRSRYQDTRFRQRFQGIYTCPWYGMWRQTVKQFERWRNAFAASLSYSTALPRVPRQREIPACWIESSSSLTSWRLALREQSRECRIFTTLLCCERLL